MMSYQSPFHSTLSCQLYEVHGNFKPYDLSKSIKLLLENICYNQVLPIATAEQYAVFELFYIIIVYPTHYSESILTTATTALACIPATPLTKLFHDTDTSNSFGTKTTTKPNP